MPDLSSFLQALDDHIFMALTSDVDSEYVGLQDEPAKTTSLLMDAIAELLQAQHGVFCLEAGNAIKAKLLADEERQANYKPDPDDLPF
jgi:hypothetical protein